MLAQRTVVRAPVAVAGHHLPERGPQLDRQQRSLVRPVFEHASLAQQARHDRLVERSDAG